MASLDGRWTRFQVLLIRMPVSGACSTALISGVPEYSNSTCSGVYAISSAWLTALVLGRYPGFQF